MSAFSAVPESRLHDIFSRFSQANIAVFGDLMMDEYISGSASRLSPEAPVPILRVKSHEARLGGAANVMHNIKALAPESKVTAFGVIGNDTAGSELKRQLRKSGITPDGVFIQKGRRTTVKQRVIVSGQQIVRMDIEDTDPIEASVQEELVSHITADIIAGKYNAIIFEDYAKGLLNAKMLQTIVNCAKKHHVFTSLDPHPGHPLEVKHLSLMTPNRMEAFGLAGMYCSDPVKVEKDKRLAEVAVRILNQWLPESLLITLGDQGMALFRKNEKLKVIPTVAREVFDVCGAGDTVIAVFTLCMAAGARLPEAAVISNQAAGIVVGKRGTATTTQEELLASFQS